MEHTQFNIFDMLTAAVLVASGIFAFRRGLIREVLSLGTWVLASVFAFSFYPMARPFLEEHIKNAMLADAATAIGLFCIAIVVLVPLGDYLTSLVKTPTLSSIDRSLGFVFGLIRGFVIMCLLYLGATYVWSNDEAKQPVWLAQAKAKPALAYGVDVIKSMTPENPEKAASEQLQKGRELAKKATENAKRLEDISVPVPSVSKEQGNGASYGDETRDKMNNLYDRNANP
ncbi:MAG: CvpA family protein [Bdellovibrionales bacterium]